MHFLHLTLLYCVLIFSAPAPALESPSSPTKSVETIATNIIFQSNDGGQTWQDISNSLPVNQQPEDFFAGDTDLYLRANQEMYRSKSNLKTPVWEKENVIDQRSTIAFNQSRVMAYSYDGHIFQKDPSSETWVPIYTNLISHSVATIFEASDGTVFLGTGKSLSKSADKTQSWKLVQEGWVGDIVESEGVLVATGQKGIMRSTDKGEHWDWVISEGGVGIVVERIKGGFAAISYNTTLKARRIHISMDSGKTWQAIDGGLQPSASISSIKQIGKYLVCGHPDGIFRSADMGKTWTMVHPSVATNKFMPIKILNTNSSDPGKVFKLYVAGYVVYAVARESGC